MLIPSLVSLSLSLSLAGFAASTPAGWAPRDLLDEFNATWPRAFSGNYGLPLTKRADDELIPLRIMPLGASITWGEFSDTQNGYRKPLRDQLRLHGWDVNMVGSKAHGSMVDNNVEAHSGDIIDQVKAAAAHSYGYKANVVTINVGTNDCTRNIDIPNAGNRMRELIDSLLTADGGDRTTVILSTLIPSANGNTEANRPNVNAQYRNLVRTMQNEGKRVVLADMDPPSGKVGSGWMKYPEDYGDPIHPNDRGYAKMAFVWWAAINEAWNKFYLQEPYPLDPEQATNSCDKHAGDGVFAGGHTQRGAGTGDGIYHHKSVGMGTVLTVTSDFDRGQWFFAKLYSRERDDFVGWYNVTGGKVIYGCWRNTRNPDKMFDKIGDLSVSDNCKIAGVNFVDINGDGLDDFVCIGPNGEAFASINNGDGTDTTPPTFTPIGSIKAPIDGFDQSRVLLADIDGDGRTDYCVTEASGDILCWRNGGLADKPAYWQPLGKRFTGKGMGNLAGTRFVDVNGDGRDDWIWVGDKGEVYTYTNSRSCKKGTSGDGLNVAWRQGFAAGSSSGPTHGGMGIAGVRNRIHFARIYGEPQDFGLLGRHDYVYLEHKEDGGKHTFNLKVWKNVGSGSTKLKADGDKYCNMMGHANGMHDYVWTLSKGHMTIFPNAGRGGVTDDGPSFWLERAVMFDPAIHAGGRNLHRRDLHLADWDGDGLCDIIWTDPNNENRVQLWRNLYRETGGWNWEYHANPAPVLHCPEKRGIGIFDNPIHFADITGNGKADYLCMEPDGRTWGYVNNGGGNWEYIDQFKHTEDLDRANFQFADVNGDGRADLIWTDKFNGDGHVYYNGGRQNAGGSRFFWQKVGKVFQGNTAGSCTYYPDLQGDKRADQHCILGTFTNIALTWFNQCGHADSIGDDPDTTTGVSLPPPPGGDASGGFPDGPRVNIALNFHFDPPEGYCSNHPTYTWTCVDSETTCEVASDPIYSNRERWESVDVQQCYDDTSDWLVGELKDLESDMTVDMRHSKSFAVGYYFGGIGAKKQVNIDKEFRCQLLGDENCKSKSCNSVQYPALGLLLQSYSNIHSFYQRLYDGIGVITADVMVAAVDDLVDNFFQTTTGKFDLLKQIMDVMGLVTGIIGSRFGSSIAAAVDKSSEATETITSVIDIYSSLISEEKSEFEQKMDAVDKMEDYVSYITGVIKQSIDSHLRFLFDPLYEQYPLHGPNFVYDKGRAALNNIIRGGTFLSDPFSDSQMSDLNIENVLKDSLYGLLIPLAWKIGNRRPTVVYIDKITTENLSKLMKLELFLELSDEESENARAELNDDYTAWALDWTILSLDGFGPVPFTSLKGADILADEDNKWHVTMEEIVLSSLQDHLLRENVPGYERPTSKTGLVGGASLVDGEINEVITTLPFQNGFATPGLFNINVCTIQLALKNFIKYSMNGHDECDTYPCCEDAQDQPSPLD